MSVFRLYISNLHASVVVPSTTGSISRPRVRAASRECSWTAAVRRFEARFLRAFSKSLRPMVTPNASITGKSRSITRASHSPSPSIKASSACCDTTVQGRTVEVWAKERAARGRVGIGVDSSVGARYSDEVHYTAVGDHALGTRGEQPTSHTKFQRYTATPPTMYET